jgi:tetratricopeptide (TPR) repeat protein
MTASDLQRWSRDVAQDPGSSSFVPLARALRRQGRRDAALAVVLRGLERNPEHVDGHALLALLHVDAGERQKAGDEWETILRLDPHNFDARRGLGFLALERGESERAREHLHAAAEARPGDPTVEQALEVARRRQAARSAPPPAPPLAPSPTGELRDPARLFAPLAREAPFLGALVLDSRGLVLAGALADPAVGDAEALAGLLGPAIEEARRSAELLDLGGWDGMMLHCEGAFLHVSPVADSVVVLAARGGAPAGWVVRTARRAQDLARGFLEGNG